MARFSSTGRRQYGTNRTIISVGNPGSGPKRGRLFMLELSSRDTPVDQAVNFDVRRVTALGTNTSVVPIAHDPADAAAVLLTGENHSAEPTFVSASELIDTSFNLKSVYRFQTAPEWGFVIPATANYGIAIELLACSSGTPNLESTIHFEE